MSVCEQMIGKVGCDVRLEGSLDYPVVKWFLRHTGVDAKWLQSLFEGEGEEITWEILRVALVSRGGERGARLAKMMIINFSFV
jgi:hypothetical protein